MLNHESQKMSIPDTSDFVVPVDDAFRVERNRERNQKRNGRRGGVGNKSAAPGDGRNDPTQRHQSLRESLLMKAWTFQDHRAKLKLGSKAAWSVGWLTPEGTPVPNGQVVAGHVG